MIHLEITPNEALLLQRLLEPHAREVEQEYNQRIGESRPISGKFALEYGTATGLRHLLREEIDRTPA